MLTSQDLELEALDKREHVTFVFLGGVLLGCSFVLIFGFETENESSWILVSKEVGKIYEELGEGKEDD